MKYISLCPSNTEFLAYLELTECLIAVDDFSDWPTDVNRLPRLGPDLNIDMDKVESLKPDLVFASLSVPGMEKNVQELQKRGVPHVVVPDPATLGGIENVIRFVAEQTGTMEKGVKLAEKFNGIVSEYKEISGNVHRRPEIYWEWWPKPVFTPGRDNWLTEMSQIAGGRNLFEEEKKASVQTDWETVRKMEPDIICLVWTGVRQERINPELLNRRPQWNELHAMKEERVYVLEEPLYCRPSPRLLHGLVKLAAILHPGMYPEYNGTDPLFV
ncbi:cobalamin-binding protein [Alteribacter lacisalsi]|uniref:Cobalamin-binding protein n=1 Tax=Alteribacter lacisalsi TaxID=2045244 RepID=A0A2W0H8S0_9BACI|nr:cobalamin-binding protein [Alteribacter lacisalsi]PYZ98264.1 cobalamin-binding protein [Alteribacter lacisalsi]